MKDYYKKDYYKILEISFDSTNRNIRSAYRRLTKIHHPDVGGEEDKMKLIIEAYEVLSDDELRKEYNHYYTKYIEKKIDHSTTINDANFKTYYWQTTSDDISNSSKDTEELWKIFIEELEKNPVFDKDTEWLINENADVFAKILKYFYVIPKNEYLIFKDQIFPKFVRAGVVLTKILNNKLPNQEVYWEKYNKLFNKSFLREGLFDYLIRENHNVVEEIFPQEFNIIGKQFLETFIYETSETNENINITNTYLIIILACLFIRGYHLEQSDNELEKLAIETPIVSQTMTYFNFIMKNKKKIKIGFFIFLFINLVSLFLLGM